MIVRNWFMKIKFPLIFGLNKIVVCWFGGGYRNFLFSDRSLSFLFDVFIQYRARNEILWKWFFPGFKLIAFIYVSFISQIRNRSVYWTTGIHTDMKGSGNDNDNMTVGAKVILDPYTTF